MILWALYQLNCYNEKFNIAYGMSVVIMDFSLVYKNH